MAFHNSVALVAPIGCLLPLGGNDGTPAGDQHVFNAEMRASAAIQL